MQKGSVTVNVNVGKEKAPDAVVGIIPWCDGRDLERNKSCNRVEQQHAFPLCALTVEVT